MAFKDPFAARVEAGMLERGLTLRGLCRAAGLDPSFFSKVLAGKRSPPSEEAVLRRIARALDLDAPELIVAAGRIPEEWKALCDDPGLFRDVHALATTGKGPQSPAARESVRPGPAELAKGGYFSPPKEPARRAPPAPRPAPAPPQRFSEELL